MTTYNYVIGYDNTSGYVATYPDRPVTLTIDYSIPLTLIRCKEILDKACEQSGRDLTKIKMALTVYDDDNVAVVNGPDGPEELPELVTEKKFIYDKTTNSLLIYDKGELVYANDNGSICTDPTALCDSVEY